MRRHAHTIVIPRVPATQNDAAPGLGAMVRRLRGERGLSQSDLARRAGCDYTHISRIESGSREPTRELVEKIADALATRFYEKDALVMAAGFVTENTALVADPDTMALARVLNDPGIPEAYRRTMRRQLRATTESWRMMTGVEDRE